MLPCILDPCSNVFRWFARLLLEGSVLPELRSVLRRDRLKDSPALITQMKPSTKVRQIDRGDDMPSRAADTDQSSAP